MKTGIQKVSVYDPLTGTVVQCNIVSPEGEFSKAPFEIELGNGNMVYGGDDSSFEFTCYELTGYNQLKAWMENETKVNMVVLGMEEHILWYEPATVSVAKVYGPAVGGRNGLRIRIYSKGGTQNILVGSNILYLLFNWQDLDDSEAPDGIADGYEKTVNVTALFGDEEQSVSAAAEAANIAFNSGYIIFPIAGAHLQFAHKINNIENEDGLLIGVTQFDFASGVEQADNEDINDALVNITTVAGCYKLKCYCVRGTVGNDPFSMDFEFPYLGVQYSEYKKITF